MRFLRWIAASGLRVTLFIAAAVGLYHLVNELRVLAGGPLNFLQRLELTALDVGIGVRGEAPPAEWRVGIAALDERAIERFGPPPWSRAVHARLVDRLTELGASAIAFDMTFEQPSAGEATALAARLRESARQGGVYGGRGRLLGAATVAEAAARDLIRSKSSGGTHQDLVRWASDARALAEALSALEAELDRAADADDPDVLFAEAIRRSGRVVLGVVSFSSLEAELLGLSEDQVRSALRRVSSSTISELAWTDGSGLTRLRPGAADFEQGLYRKYFGILAPARGIAAASRHFGTINAAPDHDGVNRRLPLVSTVSGSGVLLPTLALEAVAVALGEEVEVLAAPGDLGPRAVRVGDLEAEAELGGSVTLAWYGRFDREKMPIFSIADLLDGELPRDAVKDKVVFVAATAVGTHDQRVTPLERAVPGVYIHATLAQNLLDGRHLMRPTWVVGLELLLIFAIGLLAGLLMRRLHVVGQVLMAGALIAGWLAFNQLVLFRQGLVVHAVLPVAQIFLTLLALAIWGFVVEQRERRKTRQAFGRYLAPRVMEQVLSHPEEYLKLGGRRYEATVLFSDIRGFTTISEALSPEELGTLLNRYMTPMTEIVFRHEGTLDKYIGDAVMAFWGAPVEQPNHAVLACRASLEMIAEVKRLNVELEKEGLPRIAIGIGLSSGPMTIGNMGSTDHFAYTALGDRVNLGARLEGQTKEYGVDVLISDACYELVKGEMLCRELGALRVKGKFEPVRIYELVGPLAQTQGQRRFVDTFHEGLAHFRSQAWDEAIACFTTARALRGVDGDRTSDQYIAWSVEYQTQPPPPGWDGVRVATSK